MSQAPMIEVKGVSKRFATVEAVKKVDLTVQRGELFGLIGHNGAGKSTLFKMMLGLIPVTEGDIRIAGESVLGNNFREVRQKIGYLPENVVLYENLSGIEVLNFFADLKNIAKSACKPLLERVGLAHAMHRQVREYSKGMRQRLGFAQALLGNPQLLFLDEPTTGLDPEAIREFYAVLHELRAEGVTMILTSHILAEIQERVDRLAIVQAGQIQACGSVQSLREGIDLPLRIQVQVPQAGQAALSAVLAAWLAEGLTWQGTSGTGECARAAKRPVLEALLQHSALMDDFHIHEPSLEDVFFGYRG